MRGGVVNESVSRTGEIDRVSFCRGEPICEYERKRGEPAEAEVVTDDVDAFLAEIGFDPDRGVLTRRQAQVLAMREWGRSQAEIADLLGTSRANVSAVEGSARSNLEKARESIAFAEALRAPVRVNIPEGTDLYEVPQWVYEACDEAGVKVDHSAPDLMKMVSDEAGDAVKGRQIDTELVIGVTTSGSVRVRLPERV